MKLPTALNTIKMRGLYTKRPTLDTCLPLSIRIYTYEQLVAGQRGDYGAHFDALNVAFTYEIAFKCMDRNSSALMLYLTLIVKHSLVFIVESQLFKHAA